VDATATTEKGVSGFPELRAAQEGSHHWRRSLAVLAVAVVLCCGSIASFGGSARASQITNGTVTLSTIGTVTADTPYSSGQMLTVAAVANSTLDQASLEAAGFPSGAVTIKFLECSDPGGLVSNLPTKPTECEPQTIHSIAGANTDGSLSTTYQVLALPDANLGTSNGTTCDAAADACVVGIFSNQNDFSKPHLFSAPFYVLANGDDGGENPGDGSPLASTTTSPSNSTVVASPTTVAADGVARSKITVGLEDTNGGPVTSSKQVTIAEGSGHAVVSVGATVTDTATTDSSGTAIFTVTDTTVETVTFTVTDVTDSDLQLDATPAVTFDAPVVTPANSSVVAVPTSVPEANGVASSTITVTLGDQSTPPQPLAGKTVALAQGPGHSVITPVTPVTDAEGQASFTVTDTTPETVTYTATDTSDGIALTGQSAQVTFGTLSVSAAESKVVAGQLIVSSVPGHNDPSTGTVTVTLLAADGVSAVGGKTVTLSGSSASAQVTPPSAVTDSNGQATFTVSDATPESVTFSAHDTTDSLALDATAMVSFEVPAASTATSTVVTTVQTVPADGTTTAPINVTIRDQFGVPLANKLITVAGTPDTSVRVAPLTPAGNGAGGSTDANGNVLFEANDTTAERVTFSATDTTDNNLTVTQTVSVLFLATEVQATQSDVSASPSTVPANGTSASTITVTLRDHNRNPVPGLAVKLIPQNGSSKVTVIGSVTNSAGQAKFSVTDSRNEKVTYLANDVTDSLTLVGSAVTVTFGSPAPVPPSLADSAIYSSRSSVPADGVSTATITVMLNDQNGFPLSGRSVTLHASAGGSKITPASATTGSDGTAAFQVSDQFTESVTYTATDTSDGLTLTGLSTTVSFTATAGSLPGVVPPAKVGMAATPDGRGYWLVASDGGIFAYGDASFFGSTGGLALNRPIVAMAATPDGRGYWLVASDGGIFAFGDAGFYGSTGSLVLNRPVVGMAATPDGRGYWLVASDGGIFAFGDAAFYGSTGAMALNRPVVGMTSTPDGKGYWLVASDGGIFAFGDAAFYGSTGAMALNRPVVDMAAAPDGKGYWLVASDGGIFAFGNAHFYGSTGSLVLNQPMVGMTVPPGGGGYWLIASDGGIFAFGDVAFYGSTGG
jgi:Bacterial Ig-like domain (group 1)